MLNRAEERWPNPEVSISTKQPDQLTVEILARRCLGSNKVNQKDLLSFCKELGLIIEPRSGLVLPAESPQNDFPSKVARDAIFLQAADSICPPGLEAAGSYRGNNELLANLCQLLKQQQIADPEPTLLLSENNLSHPNSTMQIMTQVPGLTMLHDSDGVTHLVFVNPTKGSSLWLTEADNGHLIGRLSSSTFRIIPGYPKSWMYTTDMDQSSWTPMTPNQARQEAEQILWRLRGCSSKYQEIFPPWTPPKQEQEVGSTPSCRELIANIKTRKSD